MQSIYIEGGKSLQGEIKPSGNRNSAIKLMTASMFSNDDIVLDNVPHSTAIDMQIKIMNALGVQVTWIGKNKLLINASTTHSYEVPYELGSSTKYSTLLAGPLLFRFGRAILPKTINSRLKPTPINRWIDTWETLGVQVETDEKYIQLTSGQIEGATVNFKISTLMGTDNAIMSSFIAKKDVIISNAAEESEVDDLIAFLTAIGADIKRIEPRKIKITCQNLFRGTNYNVQSDHVEAVAFAVAALLTKGNISIRGVSNLGLGAFTNLLNKIGAQFEVGNNRLNVWYAGEDFKAANVTIVPAPGFLSSWSSFVTLLLTQAIGISLVHDTVYVDRFGFVQDLNRMGAGIVLKKPSDVDLACVISDESYDFESKGEPNTVAEISGPVKLRGARLNMTDSRYDTALLVAALCAEGRSEVLGTEGMEIILENFFDKLSNLGARIE